MEPQIPPANSGKAGDGPGENYREEREGSVPLVKLGLGICAESDPGGVLIKHGREKFAFTPSQLCELQNQSLIFRHIVAGVSVPSHLLLPLLKGGVHSGSLGWSVHGGILKLYPSLIRFSAKELDRRSIMDPEPGRCRRTDGKKWRCGRNVVPDQKYCEGHMHRGRSRSRKHVEASRIIAPRSTTVTSINSLQTIPTVDSKVNNHPDRWFQKHVEVSKTIVPESTATSTSINSLKNIPKVESKNTDNVNANISLPIPTKLKLRFPGSNTSNVIPAAAATTTTKTTASATFTTNASTAGGGSAHGGNNSHNRSNSSNNYYVKDEFCDCVDDNHNPIRATNYGNNGNLGPIASHGFGFSPTSVLQGVIRHNSPSFDYRNNTEPELQRCRRTDGKKWRCNREVIPDHKYCIRHIHRGAKKPRIVSQQLSIAAAAAAAVPKKAEDTIDLNTDLSISIQTSPQPVIANEEKSRSTSSDATTISDEISSISHGLAVSQ